MDLGSLAIYIVLGFIAQLIDGALGMAYGLISTSALLAAGSSRLNTDQSTFLFQT